MGIYVNTCVCDVYSRELEKYKITINNSTKNFH